jgi:hypothetical protein
MFGREEGFVLWNYVCISVSYSMLEVEDVVWSDVKELEVDVESVVRGRVVGVGASNVLVVEEIKSCVCVGGCEGTWALEFESAAWVVGVAVIVVEGAPGAHFWEYVGCVQSAFEHSSWHAPMVGDTWPLSDGACALPLLRSS